LRAKQNLMMYRKLLLTAVIGLLLVSCDKNSDSDSSDVVGNWIRRSEFDGVARTEAVSFVIGEKAYVGTGYDGTNRLKDFWEYNPDLNAWSQKASLPGAARNAAVAFTANNKAYVTTGYDGTNKLKDNWQYDPATNQWTQKADFGGSARYEAVAFAINNVGYVSTGYDGNALKDFWQYDATNDTWTQKVSMGGTKRYGAVAFVYNNKGYICTGINNGAVSTINDFWEYNPATETWTEKRKISNVSDDDYDDDYTIVRYNGVAFVLNGKAYISTGDNGSLTSTTWEYDFTNDVWTNKTSFEGSVRSGATGFSVKSKGFITTGRSSSYYFDDLLELKPDDEYNEND